MTEVGQKGKDKEEDKIITERKSDRGRTKRGGRGRGRKRLEQKG